MLHKTKPQKQIDRINSLVVLVFSWEDRICQPYPLRGDKNKLSARRMRFICILVLLVATQENIVFICTIICNQTALHFRRMPTQIKHCYTQTQRRQSGRIWHQNIQNIHSDEAAAAAANQSVQKALLETTRLQDTFPSCSIAHVCIPQVAAVQEQHIYQPMYMTTGRHVTSGGEANGPF